MQNIYVYNRKDKIGKLIWYRGIVFYPYVVTHNHSYNRMFLYSGSIDDRIVVERGKANDSIQNKCPARVEAQRIFNLCLAER